MQQYKIPQNVQIEDKIFGNILTLKQLIIIGLGGAISYVIYTVLARTYILGSIEIGLILIPGALSVAFAFVQINNISLFHYSLLFLEFILKPHRRVWNKSGTIILTLKLNTLPPPQKSSKQEKEPLDKKETLTKLEELSRMLDSNQFSHLDQPKLKIDDVEDQHLSNHAYFPEKNIAAHQQRLDNLFQKKTVIIA
jgi:hypothetical protein